MSTPRNLANTLLIEQSPSKSALSPLVTRLGILIVFPSISFGLKAIVENLWSEGARFKITGVLSATRCKTCSANFVLFSTSALAWETLSPCVCTKSLIR